MKTGDIRSFAAHSLSACAEMFGWVLNHADEIEGAYAVHVNFSDTKPCIVFQGRRKDMVLPDGVEWEKEITFTDIMGAHYANALIAPSPDFLVHFLGEES